LGGVDARSRQLLALALVDIDLLLKVVDPQLEGIDLLLKVVGALPMAVTRSSEIADTNLQGFALGFALSGFRFPSVAGAKKFGNEDARRGKEIRGGHVLASCRNG
jgi:hypothetical protein